MKRKKSFLKKITLLFVLFLIIYVGHTFATNDAVKLQGFGIIKQEEHHWKRSFKDEYLELLRRNEIKYEDAYLFEFYE